jgi:hypothetical protein
MRVNEQKIIDLIRSVLFHAAKSSAARRKAVAMLFEEAVGRKPTREEMGRIVGMDSGRAPARLR